MSKGRGVMSRCRKRQQRGERFEGKPIRTPPIIEICVKRWSETPKDRVSLSPDLMTEKEIDHHIDALIDDLQAVLPPTGQLELTLNNGALPHVLEWTQGGTAISSAEISRPERSVDKATKLSSCNLPCARATKRWC